jgi:Raf kinase inhibitor-like YbhB/YbcL family protein
MSVSRISKIIIAAGGVALGSWVVAQAAMPPSLKLTSTTFKDGTMMPTKVANMNRPGAPANPNCVGQNVSPELSWSGEPAGTKSFAITMIDPEGRGGLGVFHWVAYGIAPNVHSFAEGEVSNDSPKYVGGKSTQGVGHFSGPCTPPGSPHHYTFKVIATDLDPKALPPGLTLPEFEAKMTEDLAPGKRSHALAAAGLVGLFTHP